MQKIKGERDDTWRYTYGDFDYHADSEYPGRRFVCASKTSLNKCRATVLVKNGFATLRRAHSHPPPGTRITRPANEALKKLADEQFHFTPREVMNEVFNQ